MASQIKQVYKLTCRDTWSGGAGQCYTDATYSTKAEAEAAKKQHDAERHG